MTDLLQTLEGGLVAASVYLLIGLAWNVVYSTCGYLNIAVGEIYVLAGVLMVKLPDLLGVDAAIVVVPAVLALVGVGSYATERAIIRPLPDRGLGALIVTVGLGLVLGEVAHRLAPEMAVRPPTLFTGPDLAPGGVRVTADDLVVIVTAAVVTAALAVFLQRSDWGRSFRACADDRRSAALVGIPVPRIETAAFVISALLATVAAVVAGPVQGVTVGGAALIALKAFLAVSLFGIGRMGGAVAGALAVGLTEAVVARYWTADGRNLVVLGALLVVLLVRPPALGVADAR